MKMYNVDIRIETEEPECFGAAYSSTEKIGFAHEFAVTYVLAESKEGAIDKALAIFRALKHSMHRHSGTYFELKSL